MMILQFLPSVYVFYMANACYCTTFASSDFLSKKMEEELIVPLVLEVAPKELLNVTYGDKNIEFGTTLSPEQVKHEPQVKWKAEPKTYYTLFMFDPYIIKLKYINDPRYDLISWLFWLVTNIPENNLSEGKVLAQYDGFIPSLDSVAPHEVTEEGNSLFQLSQNVHYYLFLLYKQTKGILNTKSHSYNDPKLRLEFKIKTFIRQHNLNDSVAGTVLRTRISKP